MKNIDWKKALKAGWEESKKQPWIDGPEKWALYIVFGFLILIFLTGCSVPLVGSLGGSAVTGVVSGKASHSVASATVDIISYEHTGKTTKQHLLSAVTDKEPEQNSKTITYYEEFKEKVYASHSVTYTLMP